LAINAVYTVALIVSAVPPFDPAGAKNVGNGVGGQFIGGQCLSDADCGSGCCANPTGICSGPGASTQNGKTGCGFTSTGGAAAPAAPQVASTTASAAVVAGTSAATSNLNGGPAFDPAGAKNVGNGNGQQFIGGQCLSTADCASGCCAGPSGICSGPGASTQNGKTGCGFPSAASVAAAVVEPSGIATVASSAAAGVATSNANGGPAFDPAGAKNVGNGKGQQFIGGQCLSTADCASGCCAGPSGICSGPDASTQNGKTGCGFPSAAGVVAAVAGSSTAVSPAVSPAAGVATSNANGGPAFDPAGEKNVGNGKGEQFIGGQCLSTADCASGCCAGPSGICSGPGASTQAGKTGCGFVSSKRFVRM
jgi:hypothetical protein